MSREEKDGVVWRGNFFPVLTKFSATLMNGFIRFCVSTFKAKCFFPFQLPLASPDSIGDTDTQKSRGISLKKIPWFLLPIKL